MEFKLEYLVHDEITHCRVFAIYDCCRVPLESMPGLIDIGKGNIENAGYSAEEDEDAPIRYIHIQACGKGGVAAADGGVAERLYNHAIKFAAR